MEREILIQTPDGAAQAFLFHPDGAGPWPAVLHLMDGLGMRPAFRSVSERIAAKGYCVLTPNLYYRRMAPRAIDRETEMDLIKELLAELTRDVVARDVEAFIRVLDTERSAKADRIGVVGYCMSGKHALTAAANHANRVAAALSFHGGALATDSPESPHRLATRMKARIHCGVAEDDFAKDPCETARLRGAFEAAGVNAEIELYTGCKHGWSIPMNKVYDRAGSEKHFEKIFGLFAETL